MSFTGCVYPGIHGLHFCRVCRKRIAEPCLYMHIVEDAHEIMLIVAEDGNIIEANPAAEKAYGYTRDELVQMNVMQLRAPEAQQQKPWQFPPAHKSKVIVETKHRRKDGAIFPVEISSSRIQIADELFLFSLIHDISKQHQSRAKAKLLRVIDRLIIEGEHTNVIMQRMCDGIVEHMGYACAYVTLKQPDGSLRVTADKGLPEELTQHLHRQWEQIANNLSPTRIAIVSGKPAATKTSITDADYVLQMFKELGISVLESAPLISDGRPFGALTIGIAENADPLVNAIDEFAEFADLIKTSYLAAQRQEYLRLHTHICNSIPNPVSALNPRGLIIWLNEAFTAHTGYTIDDAYGKCPAALLGAGDPSEEKFQAVKQAWENGQVWSEELRFRKKDGSVYIAEETITPVIGHEGAILYYVSVQQDVTERKRYEKQLYFQAMHDPLTGVLNRRALTDRLGKAIAQAQKGVPCHFLLVDIDDLKLVNDTLGHSVGDELLIQVTRRLSATLRETDSLIRLGGDEFAVILSNRTLQQAVSVAQQLRTRIGAIEVCGKGRRLSPTISIGIVSVDEQKQPEELLTLADSALYEAKGKGKNKIVVHSDNLPLLSETGKWVTRLKDALKNHGFVLYFQPIIDWRNMRVVQQEALIRLIDGQEIHCPGAFLNIAEHFSLAADIDRWVVEKVLEIISGNNMTVAVNLSANTVNDPDMRAWLKNVIQQANIRPRQLTFELTESMELENIDQLNAWMCDMKALGCMFSLDDFGKGFSSFSYLRSVETDYVKIDDCFVQGVAKCSTDRSIISSIVSLVRSLGRKTIAEGVEDRVTLNMLSDLGIDYMQGYYLGKPAALDHLSMNLESRGSASS